MKNSKDTKEDSKMTRIFSIVFVVLLLAGLGFVVSGNPKGSGNPTGLGKTPTPSVFA